MNDIEKLLKIAQGLTDEKRKVIPRLNALANHLIAKKDLEGLDQVQIIINILAQYKTD